MVIVMLAFGVPCQLGRFVVVGLPYVRQSFRDHLMEGGLLVGGEGHGRARSPEVNRLSIVGARVNGPPSGKLVDRYRPQPVTLLVREEMGDFVEGEVRGWMGGDALEGRVVGAAAGPGG